MAQIKQLSDVVDWRLCIGCGACAYACPDQRVTLYDFATEGIRPVMAGEECRDCTACLDVCPAVHVESPNPIEPPAHYPDGFSREWGPVTAIWEGHATDPDIRFRGSSGGALTALAAYCLEKLGMHGVLHIAQDPDDPIRNRTYLSRNRAGLLAGAGSRYAPASVANGLGLVTVAPAPCAIIGKPGEIAAIRNARRANPALDARIGVTLSFFCAESPSTQGTTDLVKRLGVLPEDVADLRYRGHGWPGHFAPTRRGDDRPAAEMTYRESWAFLQAYRPWSVHLWPDGSGEHADISCGDPWYENPDGGNPGSSLVVARTPRGKEIVEGAIAAGYLTLAPAERWKLEQSQPNLLEKKGAVWGRRFALRLLGLPVTDFRGLDLWHCWKSLSIGAKLRSMLGTLRRALGRNYRRPLKLDRHHAQPVKPPIAR